jgi:hypothetical protein
LSEDSPDCQSQNLFSSEFVWSYLKFFEVYIYVSEFTTNRFLNRSFVLFYSKNLKNWSSIDPFARLGQYCEIFWTILRLFKEIFKEWRLLIINMRIFLKITRLFEDIFREMEASIRILRLLQRLWGFLKIFSMELRLS